MVCMLTNRLSEGVARVTRGLVRGASRLKAFQGSGLAISTVLLEAISTHFFVQTLRSVIIAPAIFEKLIPVLVGLVAAPVACILLTLIFNDFFLALTGAFLQALGRGFLLLPSDPENGIYYAGMLCSVFGYILAFLGVLGAALKRERPGEGQDAEEGAIDAIVGGIFLGMAANLALRLPNAFGINLVENVLVNVILIFTLALVVLYWYGSHRREHNILKITLPGDFKRGKEKRFRRTLHLLMVGPCFAILGFYFNRPEWIAAATGIPYATTAYIVVLSVLATPLVRSFGLLKGQLAEWAALACTAVAFVGIGFIHYLPPGPYMILLVIPAPFGLGTVLDAAIRRSAAERADNIDVTAVLSWIVALAGILASNVMSLLWFLPYTGAIIMALPIAYLVIGAIVSRKRHAGGVA